MFNDQELKVLAQLIDVAVRSKGLEVSQAGSHLATKIQEELKRREDQETEKPKPKQDTKKKDKKKDKDN